MTIQDVIRVVTITTSNHYLPSLEHKYESLKRQANVLESEKQDSAKILPAYNEQVLALGDRFTL